MDEKTSSGQQQKSIVLYILIAFGITWLCWIPALVGASRQGFALPTISNFAKMGEQPSLTGQQSPGRRLKHRGSRTTLQLSKGMAPNVQWGS